MIRNEVGFPLIQKEKLKGTDKALINHQLEQVLFLTLQKLIKSK